MSTDFSVLGGDYEDGYSDGKNGKAHAAMWWGGLKKGSYETGYNAGRQARQAAEDEAYSSGKFGENMLGVDQGDVKFAAGFLNELVNKGMDVYNRSQGKPVATPAAGGQGQSGSPIIPPQSTSSGNFLTEMRGGAPTYVWILGGGLTLTGVVLAIKALRRR